MNNSWLFIHGFHWWDEQLEELGAARPLQPDGGHHLPVGEAEQDGDEEALEGGGDGGEDVVEDHHGAGGGAVWEEDEVEAQDGDQDQGGARLSYPSTFLPSQTLGCLPINVSQDCMQCIPRINRDSESGEIWYGMEVWYGVSDFILFCCFHKLLNKEEKKNFLFKSLALDWCFS